MVLFYTVWTRKSQEKRRKQIKFEFQVLVCSLIQMVTYTHINLHFTLFNSWGSWLNYMTFFSSPLVNPGLLAAAELIYMQSIERFPEYQSVHIYCYSFSRYSFVIMLCLIDFTLLISSFGISDLGHWNFNIFTLSKMFLCSTSVQFTFGGVRLYIWVGYSFIYYCTLFTDKNHIYLHLYATELMTQYATCSTIKVPLWY